MSTTNKSVWHIGISNNHPDEQALDEIFDLLAERGRKIRLLQKNSPPAAAADTASKTGEKPSEKPSEP